MLTLIWSSISSGNSAVEFFCTNRIDNDIYSIVDACPNACEMWKAIERLKPGESINVQDLETNMYWEFGKFTSQDGESLESYYSRFYKMMNELIRNQCKSQELKTVSYHKLYDILKQHQLEVNEIRAEKITRVANPLALVAQQQPVYHPQTHPTHYNQKSSTRSQQAATRNKGKAIVNSPQPIYDQEHSVDDDDDEMTKDKEIDKLMALISLSECQKPKWAKDATYHRENMLLCKQEKARIQLNEEQADWKDNTDDEFDDQELESHYMYMAKIQEVQNDDHYDVFAIECQRHEQSESVHKTYLTEQDAHNVIIESVDMNYDSEPIDQNDEDADLAKECELLASLIEKLKCEIDESKNCNKFLETLNKVLVKKLKKLKRRDSIEYASEMELECAKYNQKEVDDLKAERLAKIQDPLALMANSNNPFASPALHQDQSPFNQNFLQQPITNPEDITDPTTAMNMALALLAKAFKLNYSTPTNNNHRISSNPRNRQIAQPGMNMGQDRQMHIIRGNGGNQFRQYAGQIAGNLNGYNEVQNVGNQVAQNPRVPNVGNQNGLIGVQRNGNQNQIGNGNLVAVRAEGNAIGHNGNQIRCCNCRGLGHFARDCTVRPMRKDAAYLQTQLLIAQKEEAGIQLQAEEYNLMTDSTPVYDTDGLAEIHENCDDNEIFNMFTQEELYTELLEPIPELHQVPHNDNDVISEDTSVEQGFPAQSVGSSSTKVLDSPCLLVLITETSQSRQHGRGESDSYHLSDLIINSYSWTNIDIQLSKVRFI
uniref:CCHC-type domain-containing protein n=1 Tax=Tanacetum cinerariifolium TaxID=118510 RepID=A0A6L2P1R4_TANCI|nr:hypothetical protein [Tanacetum cinerariifolium]